MEGSLRARIEHLLAQQVLRAEPRAGGFTPAALWSIETEDGTGLFVKVAADHESAVGNRTEAMVMRANTSDRIARFEAISEDGYVLITEDLSQCDWRPSLDDPGALFDAIAEIGDMIAPDDLLSSFQGSGRDPWPQVLADPRFASAVGIESAWLAAHGEELSVASLAADTSGDGLVHGDLAPGNWCLGRTSGWRFVDWASAHRGNPLVDEAIAAIRLTRATGRPRPSLRLRDRPEMASLIAGRFASELLDVDWAGAPPQARVDRVADIRAGLTMLAELLVLPAPTA